MQRPQGLTPHLTVADAAGASAFYAKAFGAKELMRAPAADGKRLLHVSMQIGSSMLFMHDDFPDMCGGKSMTPASLGGTPVVIHQDVPDVDAAFKRAVDAGATPRMAPEDQFWGDRYAQVVDPYGHVWSLAAPSKKE